MHENERWTVWDARRASQGQSPPTWSKHICWVEGQAQAPSLRPTKMTLNFFRHGGGDKYMSTLRSRLHSGIQRAVIQHA